MPANSRCKGKKGADRIIGSKARNGRVSRVVFDHALHFGAAFDIDGREMTIIEALLGLRPQRR